jgi:hypothetical protein
MKEGGRQKERMIKECEFLPQLEKYSDVVFLKADIFFLNFDRTILKRILLKFLTNSNQ